MSNFDEFRIDSYMNKSKESSLHEFVDERERYNMFFNSNFKVANYRNWAEENGFSVVHPTTTLEELDDLWMFYCCQPKKIRKIADDKCVELFGLTNQFLYEVLRREYAKKNIDDIDMDSLSKAATDSYQVSLYGFEDVEQAKEWSKNSGYPIIYPTATEKELNDLYDNFLSYHLEIRNASDDKSIELFGVTNQQHYEYLKKAFNGQALSAVPVAESLTGDLLLTHKAFAMNERVNTSDKAADLLGLLSKKNETYEDALIGNIIDKSVDNYVATHQNLNFDNIPGEDLPFFTPEELIDAGVNCANPEDNFYGCEPATDILSENENYQDWMQNYTNFCNGCADFNSQDWIKKIRFAFASMQKANNKDIYKQAILSLGWPPESEFTPQNRVIATSRLKDTISSNRVGSVEFIDLTDADTEDIENMNEASVSDKLKPVYIVLISGKSMFSKAIKKVTKSEYSHAAVSFDPSLHKMWSYGIDDHSSKKIDLKGGFIQEDIDNTLPFQRLAVYAIFLKPDDWDKLKKKVENYIDHAKDTSYSYMNLIVSHLLKINWDRDLKLVCSQFVDKLLKGIDVDITKIPSSLVSPAALDRASKENKKIYTLFDGRVMQYNDSKIAKIINSLLRTKKAEPIKEMNLIEMTHYLIHNIHNIDRLRAFEDSHQNMSQPIKKIYEAMIKPKLYAEEYLGEGKEAKKINKDMINLSSNLTKNLKSL